MLPDVRRCLLAKSAAYSMRDDGDYWILGLGPDCEWALVGEPSREYLWILSRTRHIEPGKFEEIIDRLPALGYDAGKLLTTPQPVDSRPIS